MRLERLQSESRANPGFRSAGDEELDKRDLVHITGEDREESRGRFLVLALVECVDDDERMSFCRSEWADDEFLYLRAKSFFPGVGTCGQDRE